MKTLWIKFLDSKVSEITPLEYCDRHKRMYPTFEAFCVNFRSGWTDSHGKPSRTQYAVTNSIDIEPLMHEWKMAL